jgi:hypothetical protein
MTIHPELMAGRHVSNGGFNGWVLEFNHLSARLAHQVFMLRISVIMVVDRSCANFNSLQQARFHQLGKSSVNGGPADTNPFGFELIQQLLGIEVAMPREDMANQLPLGRGVPLRRLPTGQVLPESVFRCLTHGKALQRHWLFSEGNYNLILAEPHGVHQ